MIEEGWTSSHRRKWMHPIFKGNALRVGVWDWLIQTAAFKEVKFRSEGQAITLQRGQLCVSQSQVCDETGITRQQLRTFLIALENEGAITTQPATKLTKSRKVITICNYDNYQSPEKATNQAATKQQPTKEQGNNSSVAKATGETSSPPDPKKVVFDSGVQLLGAAGKSEQSARGIIGKWIKAHGVGAVIDALSAAQTHGAIEPVGWIEGRWKSKTAHTAHDGAILNHGTRLRKIRPPAREAEPCPA